MTLRNSPDKLLLDPLPPLPAGPVPRRWLGPLILAAIVLVLFFPGLFASIDTVVGAAGTDTQQQFVPWRTYAFSRLAAGDFPLWNPRTFAGQALLGNWQMAVLYPPNWLHLALPPGRAITILVALHVYLAGLLTLAWLRQKAFSPAAALLGATAYMLSGPFLGHAFPGHITWLCVAAWLPGLLMCVDKLLDTGRLFWAGLGGAVVGLMLLAGYPQPVYIAGVGTAVYATLCIWESPAKGRAFLGLLLMPVLGGLLGAAQLWPGLDAAAASVRAGGTSFDFATSFSMPARDLLTVFAPLARGGPWTGGDGRYLGDGFLWECWPYAGGIVAWLALIGALTNWSAGRRRAGLMVGVFVLFALGSSTPFYRLVFQALPGASSFRVPGRWLLMATPFVAVLAAAGFDALAARKRAARLVAIITGAMLGFGLLAIPLFTGGFHTPLEAATFRPLPLAAGGVLLLIGVACAFLAGTQGGADGESGVTPRPLLAIAALAGIELVFVAHRMVVFCPAVPATSAMFAAALATIAPDTRIFIGGDEVSNTPLLLPSAPPGLGGYDPFQAKRWASFMATSQDQGPRDVSEITGILAPHPAWRLLRTSAAILLDGRQLPISDPLPHAFVVGQTEVMDTDLGRLSRLFAADFDPAHTAIVEEPPHWVVPKEDPTAAESDPAARSSARITADDGDALTIDIVAPRLGMLVITDMYAAGWEAWRDGTGGKAEWFPVMPVDHLLRGVPIPAGTYQLHLAYRPRGWVYGRWLSLVGLAGVATFIILGRPRHPLERPRGALGKPTHAR